ncbi:sugar porter family MFS transporter [Aspergillus candidus]|uniref:Putative high-affinity hexose transporter n=1 Tax=Aspergillus candidus TaxID=41067 RepID=A0A2I2F884_ASPCN|nr:putative high-affinity hexose transporter [Aspergillus candidus]PLB36840.1 putative high-affinity hexose transporter [Aspergillus candidus]
MKTIYNVYFLCSFITLGGGLFGFDISSMSGVLGTNAYTNYFQVGSGQYKQGAITCAMPFGSLAGALVSSFFADRYSRVLTIQMSTILWILGSIFMAASNGIALLVVGRVIAGICVGISSAMVPVYQAEVAPKEIRGRVISLQQWAITWGILIQYFIQYGASNIDGGPDNPTQSTAAFRIPWGIQIVPGVILFVGLFFFPKSPRWLASKDRWEEAIQVLARLHGNGDINHPKVLAEYREIEEALRIEREQANSSYQVLLEPRMFKRVILGISLQMWSQLCGMNVMMYYIVYIMQSTGTGSPLLTASIQYILNTALTLPAIIYLDKFGRRKALLIGFACQAIFLYIEGGLQAGFGAPNPGTDPKLDAISWTVAAHPSVGKAIIALSYLFVCSFSTTVGPTSWTYPAEIYPSKVRAKAVSLATASNWTWNCLLALFVPALLWSINWKMYMIFAAFNTAAFVHMFLTAPETKGYTLEEMDDVFNSGVPAWRKLERKSRLDDLEQEIVQGNLKVSAPGDENDTSVPVEETPVKTG